MLRERLRGAMAFGWALAASWGTPLGAVTCSVPTGSFPTISAAIAAPSCTAIVVGAGSFLENVVVPRTLTVSGAGSAATYIKGSFRAEGATTAVALINLRVDGTSAGVSGCWPSLVQVTGGARLQVDPWVVVTASHTASSCRIFADGFDWGTVNAWSSSVP